MHFKVFHGNQFTVIESFKKNDVTSLSNRPLKVFVKDESSEQKFQVPLVAFWSN